MSSDPAGKKSTHQNSDGSNPVIHKSAGSHVFGEGGSSPAGQGPACLKRGKRLLNSQKTTRGGLQCVWMSFAVPPAKNPYPRVNPSLSTGKPQDSKRLTLTRTCSDVALRREWAQNKLVGGDARCPGRSGPHLSEIYRKPCTDSSPNLHRLNARGTPQIAGYEALTAFERSGYSHRILIAGFFEKTNTD